MQDNVFMLNSLYERRTIILWETEASKSIGEAKAKSKSGVKTKGKSKPLQKSFLSLNFSYAGIIVIILLSISLIISTQHTFPDFIRAVREWLSLSQYSSQEIRDIMDSAGGQYNLFLREVKKTVPENENILFLDPDTPYYANYVLYPRKVYIYPQKFDLYGVFPVKRQPPILRDNVDPKFLKEKKINWIYSCSFTHFNPQTTTLERIRYDQN